MESELEQKLSFVTTTSIALLQYLLPQFPLSKVLSSFMLGELISVSLLFDLVQEGGHLGRWEGREVVDVSIGGRAENDDLLSMAVHM